MRGDGKIGGQRRQHGPAAGAEGLELQHVGQHLGHGPVQGHGDLLLDLRGVRLLTASGDDLTDSDDLGRKMMRQVAGAFAEYEKGRLVAKLRSGRQRKRAETGKKVGGRKSHGEQWPAAVALAKRLRRANPKTGERLSYRRISARLAEAGHHNESGQPFNPQSVRAMIEGPQQRQRVKP